MMRYFVLSAVFVLLVTVCVKRAHADVITGPTLNQNASNQTNSGIELTATIDSILQSVIYQNQGGADTIELATVNGIGIGQVIGTRSVQAGNTSYLASNLNWQLTAAPRTFSWPPAIPTTANSALPAFPCPTGRSPSSPASFPLT
jgi:hypothetical protein